MIEQPITPPEFDDGQQFLEGLNTRIQKQERRSTIAFSSMAVLAAVVLFFSSAGLVKDAVYEQAFQQMMAEEAEPVADLTSEEIDLAWDFYFDTILDEDLDVILEDLLAFEDGEAMLSAIDLRK